MSNHYFPNDYCPICDDCIILDNAFGHVHKCKPTWLVWRIDYGESLEDGITVYAEDPEKAALKYINEHSDFETPSEIEVCVVSKNIVEDAMEDVQKIPIEKISTFSLEA
jgi:hypothetical protein